MRMPDPGRGRRKGLPQLLAETPELAVLIDTFEQRIQRPTAYYLRFGVVARMGLVG